MTQVFTLFEGQAPLNEPALGPKVKFSVKCVRHFVSKKGSFLTKCGKWRFCEMTQVFAVFERLAPSSEDL